MLAIDMSPESHRYDVERTVYDDDLGNLEVRGPTYRGPEFGQQDVKSSGADELGGRERLPENEDEKHPGRQRGAGDTRKFTYLSPLYT